MLTCDKKIRDNVPEIRPAGKPIPRGHGARECLVMPEDSSGEGRGTPDLVKRIRGALRPEVGQQWDISRRTGDSPVDPAISHGIKTVSSLKAHHLVNPPMKTKFQQTHLDLKEAHYNSSKNMRLGMSHDQSLGLPRGVNPQVTRFGKVTERSDSIDELVAPKKSVQQVEEESNQGKELYKKSHNDWGVGEIVDRNYDWSKFTKHSLYGMETPHDNSGVLVSSALDWTRNTENVQVVSKRLDDFREKTQPQVATVHDPLVDTRTVPPDHTFGITVPVDRFGAGDLVNSDFPTTFLECELFDEGALMSVRSYLKKQKFYNFDCFFAALQAKDKDQVGVVTADIVHEIAFQFNVPLTFDMLDMLVRWCTRKGDTEGVVYEDLVVLMNWKVPLSEETLSRVAQYAAITQEKSPPVTPSSKLRTSSDFLTSSQMHRGNLGEISTQGYRVFGVPTIRSDLPAPRIKRVADKKNYGDEADGGGLIYPSIYSNHGVYEEDFFRPHSQDKIREVFRSIGIEMSDKVFQELWELAAKKHPKGEVCVETFRTVAEEMHAEVLKEQQLQREAELHVQ